MRTFSSELNNAILPAMDIHQIRKANLILLIGNQRKSVCADRWNMSPAHLSQILSDKTPKNLGEDVARRIEGLQGLPHGWLDTLQNGAEMPSRSTSTPEEVKASAAELVRQMLAKQGKNLPEETRQALLAVAEDEEPGGVLINDAYRPGIGKVGDEVWIAHYDVRGALGGGEIAHDFPEMLQDVRVSPSQLRAMGVEFKEHYHLKMITGWGQSMAPTIKHGDPLLVDVSIKEFVGDGVYFFSYQGFQFVKRLQIKGKDKFKMISDNRKHKTEDIYVDETYIQARVLLVWNANLM